MNLTIAILGFALAAAAIPRCAVAQTTSPVSDAAVATSGAAGSAEHLAKQLTNPVANLIVVPFQFDYDAGFDSHRRDGQDERGYSLTLQVQPVIPFSLNEDWLLVTRTIVPVGVTTSSSTA